MGVDDLIEEYLASQPEPKCAEMRELHRLILESSPGCKLWFSDGKNEERKVVSNPNIGYGNYTIQYADGTTKEFFRIGLSGNKSGISVYILGINDKQYLMNTYGSAIGKASVTGYCVKFKSVNDIDLAVLLDAVRFGFEYRN